MYTPEEKRQRRQAANARWRTKNPDYFREYFKKNRDRKIAVDLSWVNKRKREMKARLVDMLGGKCQRCGYRESLYALDFDHIDPKMKEFNISASNACGEEKFGLIVQEAMKCRVLCANCHRLATHEPTLFDKEPTYRYD